jgi:hypothetical protein
LGMKEVSVRTIVHFLHLRELLALGLTNKGNAYSLSPTGRRAMMDLADANRRARGHAEQSYREPANQKTANA